MIHLPDGVFRIRFDGPPAAPVLILSHPLGTDLDVWQPQIAALSHSFRVLRYDMRGHGASEVSPPGYGMERLGADVLALLDALGIARAHFCGQSMSGMIGQWLGINTPERLGKLILANTAAKIGGADLWNGRIASVETGGMGAVTGA
ncbi:MAG: alpha/beta fold hydrolase, partial [Magnetospirillum sp.]|nr:alpha/beta fold hydrolase [Magnetospirillum sp.]